MEKNLKRLGSSKLFLFSGAFSCYFCFSLIKYYASFNSKIHAQWPEGQCPQFHS